MSRALFVLGFIGATALSSITLAASPVADPSRPAADVARDANRKPAEMIAFAKIKPGQTVVDMLPGGGYFTRIFSAAVGPKGRVVALIPDTFAARRPEAVTSLKKLTEEAGRSNVTVTVGDITKPVEADGVNLIWTAQNYHDLHNPNLPLDTLSKVNAAAFASLKPGGYYVVIDHAADAGSGLRDVNTLHRIDPAVVKAEVLAAGFVLDGESKILASPADAHKLGVFDPSLRGHTDQFAYRFRKPRR
jgi:predicted methyltransferase